MEAQVILDRINDLKVDLDRRLDDLVKRLEKYENQNIINLEKITVNSEKVKNMQLELNEHKAIDREYGRGLDAKVDAIEKHNSNQDLITKQIQTKMYMTAGFISAIITIGGILASIFLK